MVRLVFVYIDESGDLGDNGSRFFVLCALIVEDYAPLDRIIKNLRRHKFRKQLRKATEIRATDSSPELVKEFLLRMNSLKGAEVIFIVLDKSKNHSIFLRENKHKLYNFVAGKLALNLPVSGEVRVIVDKSKGNAFLRKDFDGYFTSHLSLGKKLLEARITHSNSFNFSGLQAADCLAWVCFQKFEFNNENYLKLMTIRTTVSQVW